MTIQNILQERRGVWLCVSCVCMLEGTERAWRVKLGMDYKRF